MKEYNSNQALKDAVADREVLLSDLPDIDLYMEQIVTLIQEKLAPGSKGKEERLLTKTMINNYSKEGLIKPVKGKKYSKEHIVQMLMIYGIKNTLSIQEIKRLLGGVYQSEDFGSEELLKSYSLFLEHKVWLREQSISLVEKILTEQNASANSNENLLTAVLEITALSAYLKAIAQAMIEQELPEQAQTGGKKKQASKK